MEWPSLQTDAHTSWKIGLCGTESRVTKRDFPSGPVVKTSSSSAGGTGSIPGWGAKIPHASRPKNQNIKQKQYCNKFNKDFKYDPHFKKVFKKITKNLAEGRVKRVTCQVLKFSKHVVSDTI